MITMEVLDGAYGILIQRMLARLVRGKGGTLPLSTRCSGRARSSCGGHDISIRFLKWVWR